MAGVPHLRLEVMTRGGFGTDNHIPTLMEALGTAIGKWLLGIFDQALVGASRTFSATLKRR
jgi:hypothetical protein